MIGFLLYPVAVVLVFLASTIVFDVVHWLLHLFVQSRFTLLRAAASLHATHHRFLDSELRIHEELIGKNIRHHVIPEYVTQLGFSLLLLAVLPASVVAGALVLQTAVFLWILSDRGLDINHRGVEKLRAYRPLFFCVPEYHALHHVYPDAYFSSWIKLLDYLLASGIELRRKRVVWLGAEDALSEALLGELERAGVHEVQRLQPEHPDRVATGLAQADIVVCAGREAERAPSVERALARFVEAAASRRVPPEIWTLAPAPELTRSSDVIHRHLRVSEAAAANEARRLVRRILRGWHFVSDRPGPAGWLDWLNWRSVAALPMAS